MTDVAMDYEQVGALADTIAEAGAGLTAGREVLGRAPSSYQMLYGPPHLPDLNAFGNTPTAARL